MWACVGCGAGQEHTQPLSKLSYHSYQTGITVDGMVHPRVPNARGGCRDVEPACEGCDTP